MRPARISGSRLFDVDSSRLEQQVAEQVVRIEAGRAVEFPAVHLDQAADEAETVGMDAAAGEAENDVARSDRRAGQLLAALHRADAEARKIIVAGGIHARHLGRLAADQRAAGLEAALRDRGDNRLGDSGVELAGREIVEEEQRLGALDDEIVDAHGDEIDSDPVVAAQGRSQA